MEFCNLGDRAGTLDREAPKPVRRRHLLALVFAGACVAALFALGMGSPALAAPETVIAWIPSHQDDNGTNGWHEYQVCGDIVQRTMALLPDFTNVLCWE